ncbi:MAG: hypothetical protein HZA48_02405 [Planctomycetes bacterium]|nr:hypothetical protein [Planctomycetota bacterium]
MKKFLGLDIGSMYLGAVVIDDNGNIAHSSYTRHNGDIFQCLTKALGNISLKEISNTALTGQGTAQITGAGEAINPIVAQVDGTKFFCPNVRNIVYIGAGSFSLIRLTENGNYLKHTTNSACASGTGAFLDQQAGRIGLDAEKMSILAGSYDTAPPSVATRCAVFAKTDMIHLQQAGFSTAAICSGLCKSLGSSTIDSLLDGQKIEGQTVVIGGVAKNSSVVDSIKAKLGVEIVVLEMPELAGAVGAALSAKKSHHKSAIDPAKIRRIDTAANQKILRPPLDLKLSIYPDFKFAFFHIDENQTEITLPELVENGKTYKCTMGIDIGSTSTKATLLSLDKKVVCAFYRKTAGDPISATKFIFQAILWVEQKFNIKLEVLGAGTTGSGRKMIKAVIGADLEINEITAHAIAAVFIDPEVDTIIELGGQDAKFTQLQNGVVYNSVMNYVCAAGTGSFIEEQAKKLGISVWDYADYVWHSQAPSTSDRCTVYMERDLDLLLSDGWNKKQVAAAVLHSVRDNYLNKVVTGLKIGNRIYFQGATARNKALVAAFEQELQKPITVSQYCHLTGALGAALLLQNKNISKSTFKGFAKLAGQKFVLETEVCQYCNNHCNMSLIKTDAETIAWGLKCGKEYGDTKRRVSDVRHIKPYRERQNLVKPKTDLQETGYKYTIGIPYALTVHAYLPLWQTFFEELGIKPVFSKPSTEETFKKGQEFVTAEFCAPIIISHGHAVELIDKNVDCIMIPHMIRDKHNPLTSNSHFCCYVQALPSIIESVTKQSVSAHRRHVPEVLAPVIQLHKSVSYNAGNLYESMGKQLGVSYRAMKKAFKKAVEAQDKSDHAIRETGKKAITELIQKNEIGLVLIGRPYNTIDKAMNLDLPDKIAEKGFTVLTQDMLPLNLFHDDIFKTEYENMYWAYGQKILSAAKYVSQHPNLFAIYFTSFSCGPDSYLLTYFKDIMCKLKKPYLVLQFDGHGADAGYMTRIEAAIESFAAWKESSASQNKIAVPDYVTKVTTDTDELKSRTIFIPPMEPIAAALMASVFNANGYHSEVLPENDHTLAVGYKHTGGGECVPCPTTLGSLIHVIEERKLAPEKTAFFMPTACGPCRFGQYAKLDEMVLKSKGWDDVKILSPSAINAYEGLSGIIRKNLWDGIVLSDVLRKIILKIRPYETEKGSTDKTLENSLRKLDAAFKNRDNMEKTLAGIVRDFKEIKTLHTVKPKVGIVGEIYVRNSPFINQYLVKWIEDLGGEALMPSIGEWIIYTAYLRRHKQHPEPEGFLGYIGGLLRDKYLLRREHNLYKVAESLIKDRKEPAMEDIIREGEKYIPIAFQGEAILTLGRAVVFIKEDKVDAIVNASPMFCMPGTITTSIFPQIEKEYDIPAVCTFYDGSGQQNNVLIPHMHFIKNRLEQKTRHSSDAGKTISTVK